MSGCDAPMIHARRLVPLTLAAALAGSGAAQAQDQTTNRALAESLFRHGKRLMQEGRTNEACPKFAESQRLEPALGTLLNLAACHEGQQKTASAWAEFSAAAVLAARSGEREREHFARERLAALEKQLSRVVIEVPRREPGLELRFDDGPLGEGAWGIAMPVDPGEHRIHVTAAGFPPWSRAVVVAPGPSLQRIEVPALEKAAAHRPALTLSAPVVAPASPAVAAREPQPSPVGGASARRVTGFVVGGAGIAALAAGGYLGLRALADQKIVDRECEGQLCSATGFAADQRAHRAAFWSNVTFGVGLGGLAASAYLLLVHSSPAVAAARWQLAVDASGTVITAERRW
jgi:hypothetical protein